MACGAAVRVWYRTPNGSRNQEEVLIDRWSAVLRDGLIALGVIGAQWLQRPKDTGLRSDSIEQQQWNSERKAKTACLLLPSCTLQLCG